METSVQIAIISASASIIVASLTFILNKRAQRAHELRQRKLIHFQELLSAISDLAVDGIDKDEANQKFAHTVNTIVLVAPQSVIQVLMAFHDEVKFTNSNFTKEKHDRLLKELILAIRQNLDLPYKDDPETFDFHLIGSKS